MDDTNNMELEKLTKAFHSGASWFYWIAALSVVNSIIVMFNGDWMLVVGLGVTSIFDAIGVIAAEGTESGVAMVARGVAVFLNLFVVAIFVGLGWLANRKRGWAFVVGIVLYGFDSLLFLLMMDWLSFGFHCFVLFCLIMGYNSLKKLNVMESPPGAEALATGNA